MVSINPGDKPSKVALLSIIKATEIVLDRDQSTKGSILEVLLFSSLHILMKFRGYRQSSYDEFEGELIRDIYSYCRNETIIDNLPCEFVDFVNNRFQLYGEQLRSITEGGPSIPTKMAYNFYEKPLTLDSSHSFDLPKIISMSIKIKHHLKILDKLVDMIIDTYYPDTDELETGDSYVYESNDEYLSMAIQLYNNGNLDAALLSLTLSLQKESCNIDANLLYIEVAIKSGQSSLAAENVDFIRRLMTTNEIELDPRQESKFRDLYSKYLIAEQKG